MIRFSVASSLGMRAEAFALTQKRSPIALALTIRYESLHGTRPRQRNHSLANGRDPAMRLGPSASSARAGQQFPPDSPYQQADTVRALYLGLEALETPRRDRVPRPVDPNKPKAGGAWTREEEQHLRDAFAAHKSFHEMVAAHGRTTGAITARLVKLGLIKDNPYSALGVATGPRPAALPAQPASGLNRRNQLRPVPSEVGRTAAHPIRNVCKPHRAGALAKHRAKKEAITAEGFRSNIPNYWRSGVRRVHVGKFRILKAH